MRAMASPPLTESNLLQLLAASPPTPWVHSLGENLLHHLRSTSQGSPPSDSPLALGVWATLQQFSRVPLPHAPGASSLPSPASCFAAAPRTPSHAACAPCAPAPASPSQGACFRCGLPGHWARNCPQPRQRQPEASTYPPRPGNLSTLPGGQTVFTAASGRVYDAQSPPPYPCGRCGQLHWCFQPCPGGAGAPLAP